MSAALAALRRLGSQHEKLSEKLAAQVATAREEGAAWQEIGDALGITRQAAHKRFREKG